MTYIYKIKIKDFKALAKPCLTKPFFDTPDWHRPHCQRGKKGAILWIDNKHAHSTCNGHLEYLGLSEKCGVDFRCDVLKLSFFLTLLCAWMLPCGIKTAKKDFLVEMLSFSTGISSFKNVTPWKWEKKLPILRRIYLHWENTRLPNDRHANPNIA